MEIISISPDTTKQAGAELARKIIGGAIVCLHGDLGAGKTTFTKGFAEGLGLQHDMTSPTFTLMNVYRLPHTAPARELVHIDTYRLESEAELIGIGVEDYLGLPHTITLIEWPEKISSLLHNKKVINVTIDHLEETTRKITVQ
jgi:tRNA threonylcarbamoyladenosine biosynthesis protein TsaE